MSPSLQLLELDLNEQSCIVYTSIILFTTVVEIGLEQTMFTVGEDVGTVELCVHLITPPSLDQVPDLEVFLSAETNNGTASTLRLHYMYMCNCFHGNHKWYHIF